jgi:signal transduction histidine kinase
MAAFTVRDEGLGIPAEAREKLFGKFYRAPNVTEGIEGTGLGLYIVKAVMEKHGGSVDYVSEEGKGTTFTLRVPAAQRVGGDGTGV